ncbi:cell envelope biogenesis protein TolA [Afipia sp. TerB]
MARKLKTYEASLGFFETAIAAPSMRAALEAWGSNSNLFHQGIARESDDPAIVAATMHRPGVILRRPIGSNGPFQENADLPSDLPGRNGLKSTESIAKRSKPQRGKVDNKSAQKAEHAYEQAQKRREAERRKEEVAWQKKQELQKKTIERVEAKLEQARQEHEQRVRKISLKREAVEKQSKSEETRWHKERRKLEATLRNARR